MAYCGVVTASSVIVRYRLIFTRKVIVRPFIALCYHTVDGNAKVLTDIDSQEMRILLYITMDIWFMMN